jgi:ketosteroid isomerase-like protein
MNDVFQQLPYVIQQYLSSYNRMDVAGMMACMAENVTFEHVSRGTGDLLVDGRRALGELARQSAEAFREREQVPLSVIAEGNRLAVEILFSATLAADMGEHTAGQRVRMRGVSLFTLEGGQIVRLVDLA